MVRTVPASGRVGYPGPLPPGSDVLPSGHALGRLCLGRPHLVAVTGSHGVVRSRRHLVLAVAHSPRGALLAADLYHLLAGTQDLGTGAGRLSRGQRAAAPAEHLAGVASAAAPGRARGLGGGGRVRRAPPARGVGGLDYRAQGRAFRFLLPGCRAGVAALPGTAATLALRPGSAAVRGGPVEQVHRGDAAGGAADPAVVEEQRHHRSGSAAGGALLPGGADHHGPRSLLIRFKARFPGLLPARADAHRVAGLVVLRGQAGLADRPGHHLPALGHRHREPLGLAVPWPGRRRWRQRCGSLATRSGAGRWPEPCSLR